VDGATVSVAVVASRTEAELIVGVLRSHGLRAAVAADDAGGQEPQLQLQGVRVLVASADEASARRLAAADDTPRKPVNRRNLMLAMPATGGQIAPGAGHRWDTRSVRYQARRVVTGRVVLAASW
jgi:hypothetical protein